MHAASLDLTHSIDYYLRRALYAEEFRIYAQIVRLRIAPTAIGQAGVVLRAFPVCLAQLRLRTLGLDTVALHDASRALLDRCGHEHAQQIAPTCQYLIGAAAYNHATALSRYLLCDFALCPIGDAVQRFRLVQRVDLFPGRLRLFIYAGQVLHGQSAALRRCRQQILIIERYAQLISDQPPHRTSAGAIAASNGDDRLDIGIKGLLHRFALIEDRRGYFCILLALLYLGVKRIHLGPTLPAFLSPNVTKVLVDKFDIAGIGTVEDDIKLFFGEGA